MGLENSLFASQIPFQQQQQHSPPILLPVGDPDGAVSDGDPDVTDANICLAMRSGIDPKLYER